MKVNLLVIAALITVSFNIEAQPVKFLLHDSWKAKRAIDVKIDGTEITDPGFKPTGWLDAVIPGTILTTLLHNDLIPDPFFGMNNNLIPDVYETGRDYYTYWFFNEFEIPAIRDGQEVWLNFRGINYFAEIFLNGKRVNTSTHEGMYLREKYLITSLITKGGPNKLAVWVAPPDPAGNAAAGQGGDGTIGRNVTMQCTAGWDWICPIRDRNTGIWDQVSVEITGPVDLKNPFIAIRVPGTRIPRQKQDPAYVTPSAELKNVSSQKINGVLRTEFEGYKNSVKVTLNPGEEKLFTLPEMKIENPQLWWPNGMGDQPLFEMKMDFTFGEWVRSGLRNSSFRDPGNG